MISITDLPTLNAALNGTSTLLLLAGYHRIRCRDRAGHKAFMLAALATSALFLISYLVYHANTGSTRFQGQGGIRILYFSILLSHTVLAATVVPLVIAALRYALGQSFDRHRKVARWTFPVWLYVSITGVVVYLMLYRLKL
jgi:uncharacterized membrane protein YozB (DUF420 family)